MQAGCRRAVFGGCDSLADPSQPGLFPYSILHLQVVLNTMTPLWSSNVCRYGRRWEVLYTARLILPPVLSSSSAGGPIKFPSHIMDSLPCRA
jgi:hypothetical protein